MLTHDCGSREPRGDDVNPSIAARREEAGGREDAGLGRGKPGGFREQDGKGIFMTGCNCELHRSGW